MGRKELLKKINSFFKRVDLVSLLNLEKEDEETLGRLLELLEKIKELGKIEKLEKLIISAKGVSIRKGPIEYEYEGYWHTGSYPVIYYELEEPEKIVGKTDVNDGPEVIVTNKYRGVLKRGVLKTKFMYGWDVSEYITFVL